jgi:predicted ATPase
VFGLAALPLPTRTIGSDVATVQGFASLQLFCERAGAIRPDFEFSEEDAAAIAGICRSVDGLPLAVELAAARVTHLGPTVLATRLEARASSPALDTLSRGASDLPARQRTMRDTIGCSYKLLSAHEQRLLRRMSVFDADCSLEAIEAVCSDEASLSGTRAWLVGASLRARLAALVDLHLVEPHDSERDQARFRMLVPIRELGRERLVDANERQALQARHAEYYLRLVDEAAVALNGPAEGAWSQRLERELVETRAALRHWVATDNVGRAPPEARTSRRASR